MNTKSRTIVVAAMFALAQSVMSENLPEAKGTPQASLASTTAASAAASISGGTPLTLGEAISRALANAPLIRGAEAVLAAARAGVGQARSAYFPMVSAAGSYTRVEPNQTFTFPGLGSFSLGQENNWDFHLGLREEILSFGKRSAGVQLAGSEVASGRASLDAARLEIAYQVARSFNAILFYKAEIDSLDQQLRDLDAHLRAVEKKEQTGSATRYDVLKTRAQVASMESARVDAVSRYMKQRVLLSVLVGTDPTEEVALAGTLAPPELSGTAASFIAQAFVDRPDIRGSVAAVSSAEVNRRLAGLSRLPSLSTVVEAGYKNGLLPDPSSLTFNWNAGVTLSVPLFSGFEGEKKIEEASARLEQARENLAAARQSAETEVLQAFQDYASARQFEEISHVGLDEAQAALDAAKVQYDLGVITNTEYLDAHSALEQAKLQNLEAIYREVQSVYELKQATGAEIW